MRNRYNSRQIDGTWKCKHDDVKVKRVAAGATKLIYYMIEISTNLYYYLLVCVLDDQAESEKKNNHGLKDM